MTNDFGSVVINTNSGAASFTITNTGEATSGSITPVITGAAAADFVPTNGCTTLAGGGTCVITVVFRPGSAGVKNANLVVSGSPGGSAMATLIGTGQTPGTLTITPSSLAFGNQVNGTPTASQTFTVTNAGTVATTALTVTKAGTDPADFVKGADTCNTMTLAGGATCTIAVTFNPTSAGPKAASFVISAATGGSVNGSVTGTGLAPARLSVVPGFQDFGSVTTGTSSGNISFTVTNEGDVATSAISDSFTGANGAEFSRISSTCTSLAPNASCTIVVRFTPTTVGAKSANLAVTSTTGGTATASLIGAAVAPGNLSISPTPFAFADTTVGQVSTTQIFTVTNTGGSVTGALGTALGGTDPSHFTVVAASNGCQGIVLAPAGTCTIVLSFAPTTGGLKSATLAINHTGGSTTAAISGTGIAPPLFTLAPASRDFGSVVTTTTSAPQNFVLTNTGGQTSGIPAFAVNGANASEFAVNATGCPAALAPGGTCTVQVTFSPATPGPKAASLDVTGAGGPVSSALSGNGIGNAALAVNPSIINFPLTLIGNSSTVQSFTVTNNGSVDTGALAITIVGAAPGDYTQVNNCTDGAGPGVDFLIPGASCNVTVTFSPTTPGLRSATVQVSGTPGNTVGTAVNGNALAKLEIETPVPVTFPINMYAFPNSIVDPDVASTVQVTLRNNNTAPITVTEAPTFGGNFVLSGAPCTTIAAGATCVATYAYTPQTIGNHTGNVIFTVTGGGAGNTAQQNFSGMSNLLTLAITDAFGGQLTGPPVDTTPTSHNFGNRAVGTSSNLRTFRVTNEGNMPTGILAVDLTGAGFQIESNDCSGRSLADGDTCTVVVVFTPTATAAQMATITVRTSQGAPALGGTVTATVTGTGTAPTGIVSPTALNWGTVFAGATGTAITDRTFTVTNPNDVSTTLSFSIQNGPTSYARVTGGANDCTATLAGGASCVVTIRLTPQLSQLGVRPTATVIVTLGTGALSATVTLDATVRSTISLVAAPTPFTNVVFGTSASQTITVRNDSPQTVTGFTITAPGPYAILANTCSLATLMAAGTAGDTCTFSLVYTPTSAPTSSPTTVTVLGGSTGSASGAVAANSITPAELTLTGTDTDFGSGIVGQPGSSRVYTVTNIGQQTSGVVMPSLMVGANFSIVAGSTCTTTLAFNASCTVTVRFNPTQAGAVGDTLFVTATPGSTESLALTGVGTAVGGVQVTPTAFTFANTTVGQLSTAQTFTVQNTNGVSAAALAVSTTAHFSVASTTCPSSLAAGASCVVQVQFAPTAAGELTGDLVIAAGVTAALSGRGLTVATVVNNLGATFSNAAAITITDNTAATPNPSNINVTGIAGNVSYVSVTLRNFTHAFGDDVDVALRSPDGRTLTLMSDVGSGNVNNVTLTFEDSAASLVPALTYSTGTFRPTDRSVGQSPSAAGVEPDPYTTLGTATQSAPQGTGTLSNVFNGAQSNGTWSLFVMDDTGIGAGSFAGGWSITLNTVAFGDQTVNTTSGTRTVIFSNTGETTAAPLTALQTGPDGSHFVITNGCANVALTPVGTAGSTCSVVAAFAPTTTGSKTTQLDFTGPVATTIVFTGTGVNPAMLSISPSVLQNDGSRVIGATDGASTVFTISNLIGSATTAPIMFTLSDTANYTFDTGAATTCLLNGNQTLPAGGSCNVGVFFNPTQLGVRAGNLVATANNTVMGLMTGTGTDAIVFVPGSSGSLAWGNATVGTAPAARNYVFQNASAVSTTLVQTSLVNTAGTDFSVVSDTCGGLSLSPGQTCTVRVRFVPSGVAGARAATLTEQTTAVGTTTTAAITLTGNAQ